MLQFIKYVLAGGLATLVHILVFHLVAWKLFPALRHDDHAVRLLRLKIRPVNDYSRARNAMIGNGLAFCVSCLVAYIANILWVFQPGRHGVLMEIMLFYGVSALSMALGSVLMGQLIRRFRLLTTYAFSANIVTAVVINYVVRKYVIFNG